MYRRTYVNSRNSSIVCIDELPRLTAFACGNLCCRRGGPMERSALGRKLHLSLQRKGGSPTGFRLLRAVFSSQLCQLLTTIAFSREQKQTSPKVSKKGSQGVQSSKHNSIDLAATSAVAIVRKTGLGGWARTNLQCERLPAAALPSFSKRMDGPGRYSSPNRM